MGQSKQTINQGCIIWPGPSVAEKGWQKKIEEK